MQNQMGDIMARKLHIVYILPSRYDDEGYVNRYWRGVLPSNTLAVMKTLTLNLAHRGEIAPDVDVTVEIFDDSVQRVPVRRIVRKSHARDTRVVVGFVGVQSNQFPRATDLALQFRTSDIPVLIGGFHVSGVLSVFGEPTPELQQALDHGVTLVRGEAESPGVLAGLLRDAYYGTLKPIYEFTQPPDLSNAPVPQPDAAYLRRFVWSNMGTVDTSRGCPFNCSFCTIINVQGRTMRHRSHEAILYTVRANYDRGINTYFFTDDNLSRSPVWEPLFDGLIQLREEGMPIHFMMQVDTQSWKLAHFVDKATAAGCYLVFVGMETINPENIAAVGKRQNKVGEYAAMVETWRKADVLVEVGYIIGFPHDTKESVRRDLAALRDEIKVDEAAFFMLTPLPGSRDHKHMVETHVPIDADLNNLDSFHETFRHQNLVPGEWRALYEEAWDTFYSKEHIVNVLMRTDTPDSYWRMFWLAVWNRYSKAMGTHPMVTGLLRLKGRKERRPMFEREGVLRYARRRTGEMFGIAKVIGALFFEFQEIWMLTRKKADPRWAALAEFRAKWAVVQQRVAECDPRGRCDEATQELRRLLESASSRLHELCAGGAHLSRRVRRRIQQKALEVDERLRSMDVQAPSWRRVVQTELYIKEGLLAGYEDLAIRYVARRRQFDAYRHDLFQRLKTGRILTLNVALLPRVVVFELVMAVRFGMAFYTKIV
jgi:radical SAM superfamily enzyme YgiQ (UPF0313 family)